MKASGPEEELPPVVLTIGHSTRTLDEFIRLLQAHGAKCVVDVRTVPRSRHNPQFNKTSLPVSLKKAGLSYVHQPGLCGLRHARRNSVNRGWRNASFRGYADFMQTPEFAQSQEELIRRANQEQVVLMCAEAVPWRCHRSLIADALLVRGVRTEDIMSPTHRQVHTLTPFGKIKGIGITYPAEMSPGIPRKSMTGKGGAIPRTPEVFQMSELLSQHVLKNLLKKLLALNALLSLTGCQHYRPEPLSSAAVEQALSPASAHVLRVETGQLRHPILKPVMIGDGQGLSPDEAAIIAVVINPSLRAERDRRGLAAAQLFQAGIIPNPQLSGSADFVTGGTLTPGLTTGYGLSLSWDVQALIQRGANRAAASSHLQSVSLDIAWKEWQTAESAKLAVYQVAADEAELASAEDVNHRLADNLAIIKRAVNAHIKTAVDLATAESASQAAHDTMLGLQQNLSGHRILLTRSLGVPPETAIRLEPNIVFPSRVEPPSLAELQHGLENRRLDLLGLKRGYDSQEARVRAAILGQFPKISLGFNAASDTSNVHTVGPAVTIGLPVFDRNQGAIAIERATRQQLFDEYVNRVFEARSDMAKALADNQSLNDQVAAAEAAVPILERLVETYRIALNERSVDAFSYYSAQNNLDQERIQLLKLKLQLVQNHVALELAAGLYLPFPNATVQK